MLLWNEEEETVEMEPVAARAVRQITKANLPLSSNYLSFKAFALDFFLWELNIRLPLMLFYLPVTSYSCHQPNQVENSPPPPPIIQNLWPSSRTGVYVHSFCPHRNLTFDMLIG